MTSDNKNEYKGFLQTDWDFVFPETLIIRNSVTDEPIAEMNGTPEQLAQLAQALYDAYQKALSHAAAITG